MPLKMVCLQESRGLAGSPELREMREKSVAQFCPERREGRGEAPGHMSLRPSMALSMVISSVYSISLPTGMPMAMRVIFTPARFNCCER